jgi:hypothetical protein
MELAIGKAESSSAQHGKGYLLRYACEPIFAGSVAK